MRACASRGSYGRHPRDNPFKPLFFFDLTRMSGVRDPLGQFSPIPHNRLRDQQVYRAVPQLHRNLANFAFRMSLDLTDFGTCSESQAELGKFLNIRLQRLG